MRVVFFGTPAFVIPVAQGLKDHFDLVAVVTSPDQPVGRKQIMTPPPVKIWALENKIPVFQPEKLDLGNWSLNIGDGIDLFVVAAYGKIIPQSILNIPTYGAINIHPSRLPKLRGSSPIQTSILTGITNSAVTLIVMDEQMDHGPILHTHFLPIHANETFLDVAQKAFSFAAMGLHDVLNAYTTGFLQPEQQNDAEATYCKHISKQDGFIDLENPPTPDMFDRMVRAYYPWPNTWATLQIKNQEAKIKFLPENHVQLEGKKPVDVETFYRGYPELKEKIEKLYQEK